MGCSASKDNAFVTEDQQSPSQCAYSKSSSTKLPRTLSSAPSFIINHFPTSKCDDTNHLVSLTSTTYGFLGISTPKDPSFIDQDSETATTQHSKLAKVFDSASFSPHSVINTWELMEGLDEFTSDFVGPPLECPENAEKIKEPEVDELVGTCEIVEYNDSKPLWQHLSVEQLLSKMDPNVDSSYRKALRSKRSESIEAKDVVNKGLGYSELDSKSDKAMPQIVSNPESKKATVEMDLNPKSKKAMGEIDWNLKSKKAIVEMNLNPKSKKAMGEIDLNPKSKKAMGEIDLNAKSKKAMGEIDLNPKSKKAVEEMGLIPKSKKAIPEMDLNRKKEFGCKELHERSFNKRNSELNLSVSQDKIVLYYTSMRGIRKTYQDCCEIRTMFRGYGVVVDERDTSMDPSYRKELQYMLKEEAMSLPQVFVRGEYIGGVEHIRRLHETGHLGELLKGFPSVDHAFACERCGDARFVLCLTCNGSRKVFEENKVKTRCFQCNENGLIRCPNC